MMEKWNGRVMPRAQFSAAALLRLLCLLWKLLTSKFFSVSGGTGSVPSIFLLVRHLFPVGTEAGPPFLSAGYSSVCEF